MSWARRDIRSRYRQSALHLVWMVLQPVSVITIYAIVFRQILEVDGGDLPYLSFVVVGMIMWRFFSVGLGQATALVDQANVLSKISFRREIVPLSACTGSLVDLAIGTVAMVVVAAIQGISPSPSLLALVPIYAVLVLYTFAVGVLVATVTVFARDLALAMSTIQQLLFFATPVMYSGAKVIENFGFIAYVNPLWFVLEAGRDAVLRQTWPEPAALALHLAISAAVCAAAIRYLRAIEHRIVDIA